MMEIKRQKTSMKRQPQNIEWRTLAKQYVRGTRVPDHEHQTGQLVFAISGVMLVETATSRWTIPPQRALWIPPASRHAIRALSHTELRTVYFHPSLIQQCEEFIQRDRIHAIVATPLIKEMVLGLFDSQHGHHAHYLMAHLLLQILCEVEPLATELPIPSDERLRCVVTRVLNNNDWNVPIHELAALALMSERSFTRHFTANVGLSFREWRQRARIVASLDLLAANHSIKSIAHAMQFASPAAYIASFKELLGCTPNEFRQ